MEAEEDLHVAGAGRLDQPTARAGGAARLAGNRALAFILTPGQAADTSMLPATLEQIPVLGPTGRPRTRPERVIADKGYPSRANRAWLRERMRLFASTRVH